MGSAKFYIFALVLFAAMTSFASSAGKTPIFQNLIS